MDDEEFDESVNGKERMKEVLIQPTLAEPLITAIDTGKWGITKLAIKSVRDYYTKELKYNDESTLKLLRTAYLTDEKTIYEYACHGGHLEVAQQLCGANLSPENDTKMKECNACLISKVQTSDDNDTALSVTQLLCTTMEMLVLRDKHTLASQYYHVRHQYLLFLPASILTAVSAALAFVTSSIDNQPLQKLLVIVVGIIATVSTFIQTLSDQLGLAGKADIHRTASQALEEILLSLNFAGVDAIKNGGSAFGPQQLEIVRKQATSIESSCSDPVPEFINSIYDIMINEIELHFLEAQKYDKDLDDGSLVIQMQMRLVTEITHEFVMYWGWPWCVRKSKLVEAVKLQIRRQVKILLPKDIEHGHAMKLKSLLRDNSVAPEVGNQDMSRVSPYIGS
jgi:hypothetical protein